MGRPESWPDSVAVRAGAGSHVVVYEVGPNPTVYRILVVPSLNQRSCFRWRRAEENSVGSGQGVRLGSQDRTRLSEDRLHHTHGSVTVCGGGPRPGSHCFCRRASWRMSDGPTLDYDLLLSPGPPLTGVSSGPPLVGGDAEQRTAFAFVGLLMLFLIFLLVRCFRILLDPYSRMPSSSWTEHKDAAERGQFDYTLV
ncbi:hypothetical protein DPEC_G00269080 [Dallia pectoralis]|uniref:Uncharacterized protein n=1 Tax=Dallia pectoralis TaxID=75939 RepID=A0ACC2FP40_DALPE|nr:hypothetical protein DPEC_G00269080 [Dallia pectoralis]